MPRGGRLTELISRPAHLSDAEAAVFRDVVGTADGGHFRPKDRELLSLYCAHVVQGARSDEAEAADGGAATGFACCHRADHVAVDEIATGAQEPDHRRAASAGLRASAKPGERRPWEEAEQESSRLAVDFRFTPKAAAIGADRRGS